MKLLADLLRDFEKTHGGVVGYLGGDNFGLFAVCELLELRKLRLEIEDTIKKKSDTIGYMPAFGVYAVGSVSALIKDMSRYQYLLTYPVSIFL